MVIPNVYRCRGVAPGDVFYVDYIDAPRQGFVAKVKVPPATLERLKVKWEDTIYPEQTFPEWLSKNKRLFRRLD
jgi:hypothetical protein